MRKIFLAATVLGLILSSCGADAEKEGAEMEMHEEANGHEHSDGHNHGVHEHGNTDSSEERNIEGSTNQNKNTGEIIDAYLQIKNGLAADDKDAAAKGGQSLIDAFENFDMTQLSGEQHTGYMDIMENAKEQAEHIVKSPIDHQREHFEVVSVDINDLIKLLGTDKSLYQDFCPMANNGKGAIWLSAEETISNPYMGSKMPGCGEVQKRINE